MKKQPQVTDATRKSIVDAFWRIYQHKRIDHITVREIASEANVHRSTFYRYFEDVYDLLNRFEEELLTEIYGALQGKRVPMELVEALSAFAERICHLTGTSGDSEFRKKLEEKIKPIFLSMVNVPADSPVTGYLFTFAVSTILTNLHYWNEHRELFTIQQVAEMSLSVVGGGLARYTSE